MTKSVVGVACRRMKTALVRQLKVVMGSNAAFE